MHSRAPRTPSVDKQPFDIDRAIQAIRKAVAPYPKAALFELAAEGYASTFELLIACILSIRTRDETTLEVARRMFAQARSPAAIAALSTGQLETLIAGSSFYEPKARQIHEIARQTLHQYGGELPCEREVLLSFHGVGPKCANLVLGIACGEPAIGVDVHVHRVTNRWGYVQTKSPERTMTALQEQLPRRYWVEINALLVPFGKHICTGVRPKCSTCPVLEMCQQVGVTIHR